MQFVSPKKACVRCHVAFPEKIPKPLPVVVIKPEPLPPPEGSIACRIQIMRLRAGMSQLQLGALMGAPRSYVWKVEADKCTPGGQNLLRFAIALNCELKDLIPPLETGREKNQVRNNPDAKSA
jgi:DNA-binding XRE family transcriptional regulator